jgi:hypothetical protein
LNSNQPPSTENSENSESRAHPSPSTTQDNY